MATYTTTIYDDGKQRTVAWLSSNKYVKYDSLDIYSKQDLDKLVALNGGTLPLVDYNLVYTFKPKATQSWFDIYGGFVVEYNDTIPVSTIQVKTDATTGAVSDLVVNDHPVGLVIAKTDPLNGGITLLGPDGQPIDVGGSSYPAVTIEHLPAGTALASTVTPGGIVSRFGFGKQIAIDVVQAGGSSVVGDIEIAWTNDAGATFGAYSKIGDISASGTATVVIPMADATGLGFRVRLANVTGTLSGATAGIFVRLS